MNTSPGAAQQHRSFARRGRRRRGHRDHPWQHSHTGRAGGDPRGRPVDRHDRHPRHRCCWPRSAKAGVVAFRTWLATDVDRCRRRRPRRPGRCRPSGPRRPSRSRAVRDAPPEPGARGSTRPPSPAVTVLTLPAAWRDLFTQDRPECWTQNSPCRGFEFVHRPHPASTSASRTAWLPRPCPATAAGSGRRSRREPSEKPRPSAWRDLLNDLDESWQVLAIGSGSKPSSSGIGSPSRRPGGAPAAKESIATSGRPGYRPQVSAEVVLRASPPGSARIHGRLPGWHAARLAVERDVRTLAARRSATGAAAVRPVRPGRRCSIERLERARRRRSVPETEVLVDPTRTDRAPPAGDLGRTVPRRSGGQFTVDPFSHADLTRETRADHPDRARQLTSVLLAADHDGRPGARWLDLPTAAARHSRGGPGRVRLVARQARTRGRSCSPAPSPPTASTRQSDRRGHAAPPTRTTGPNGRPRPVRRER